MDKIIALKSAGLLAVLLCAAILSIGGCDQSSGPLVLSGNLETDDHDLIAPATVQLLSLRVREGERVGMGDTVVILDTVSAAAAFRAAQAAENEARAKVADLEFGTDREKIRAARAQVEIARANLQQAERNRARSDSLFMHHLIDAQAWEQARLQRDNATSSLKVAQESLADLERGARTHQLEAAHAAFDRASSERTARQRDFERLILTATRAGVIQFLPYQVGEYIPAGRAVATINDPDDLWAKVYVPEARLGQIAIGKQVRFRVDGDRDRDYTGTIIFIASEAEFTPRNVETGDERLNLVFAVKIAITPGQQGLRPGMPADFSLD